MKVCTKPYYARFDGPLGLAGCINVILGSVITLIVLWRLSYVCHGGEKELWHIGADGIEC